MHNGWIALVFAIGGIAITSHASETGHSLNPGGRGAAARRFTRGLRPAEQAVAECQAILRTVRPDEISLRQTDEQLDVVIRVAGLERMIAVMEPYSQRAAIARLEEERTPEWIKMVMRLKAVFTSAVPFANNRLVWSSPLEGLYENLWRFYERDGNFGSDHSPAQTSMHLTRKITLSGTRVASWLAQVGVAPEGTGIEPPDSISFAMDVTYMTLQTPAEGTLSIVFSVRSPRKIQGLVLGEQTALP